MNIKSQRIIPFRAHGRDSLDGISARLGEGAMGGGVHDMLRGTVHETGPDRGKKGFYGCNCCWRRAGRREEFLDDGFLGGWRVVLTMPRGWSSEHPGWVRLWGRRSFCPGVLFWPQMGFLVGWEGRWDRQTDKQTGRREEESIPSERGDFCVRKRPQIRSFSGS